MIRHKDEDRGLMDRQGCICVRLNKFRYASERGIRLYGQELHLVSNPAADDRGYTILAMTVTARCNTTS